MKKVIAVLSGLLLICSYSYSQQDNEPKKRDCTLTISIAPTFFTVTGEDLNSESFLPAGFYVTKDFILKPRLSLSSGIHFISKKYVNNGFIISDFIPGYSGPTKTTNRYSVIDIPLQINYYLIKPNDKFNLYAKTEILNAFIANYTKSEPDISGKYGSHTDYGYNMFFGIGFGLDFKLVDRLSFVIEPGFNYSLIGLLPETGLLDCKFGVKYTFTRK
jgi:hypothetical protein